MVIGAPYSVKSDLMNHFRVDVVVHGMTEIHPDVDGSDPYSEPKRLGKFKAIDSSNRLSTFDIVERIIANSMQFRLRNKNKEKREIEVFNKLNQLNGAQCLTNDP